VTDTDTDAGVYVGRAAHLLLVQIGRQIDVRLFLARGCVIATCCMCTSDVSSRQRSPSDQPTVVSCSCHDNIAASFRRRTLSVAGQIVWILVTRVSSGPNAEHRQSHIGIKYSPVRGAKGHIAH